MNSIWLAEDKRFQEFAEGIRIPNAELTDVDRIVVKAVSDVEKIPPGGGCYWIWTNEPVLHYLHRNKLPLPIDGGELIYNGIAKDDLRGRVMHHLFGDSEETWSGISVDLYKSQSTSHRKKAMSQAGKVAYFNSGASTESPSLDPIRDKDQLFRINLSEVERGYVASSQEEVFFFRNGINILDDKHSGQEFRIYYIVGITSLYLEYIEKKWRETNGLPRLCSYSSGR